MWSSFWRRLLSIFGAKANRALDAAENPADTLDYSYEQMLVQMTNVKRGIADVTTAKKQLEFRRADMADSVVKLEGQARELVAVGKDDLARRALTRKASAQQQLRFFDEKIEDLHEQQEKLIDGQAALERRIGNFRSEKEVIKAQYSAAKAQVQVGEAATGIGEGLQDTGRAIGRAQEKVEQLQARASAIDELTAAGALDDFSGSDTQLDRELAAISTSKEVDDEFARMKNELGGGKKSKALNK